MVAFPLRDLALPTRQKSQDLAFMLRALVGLRTHHDRGGTATLGDDHRLGRLPHPSQYGRCILAKVGNRDDVGYLWHTSNRTSASVGTQPLGEPSLPPNDWRLSGRRPPMPGRGELVARRSAPTAGWAVSLP